MLKIHIYKILNRFLGDSKEFQIQLNEYLKSTAREKDKAIRALGVTQNKGEKHEQS